MIEIHNWLIDDEWIVAKWLGCQRIFLILFFKGMFVLFFCLFLFCFYSALPSVVSVLHCCTFDVIHILQVMPKINEKLHQDAIIFLQKYLQEAGAGLSWRQQSSIWSAIIFCIPNMSEQRKAFVVVLWNNTSALNVNNTLFEMQLFGAFNVRILKHVAYWHSNLACIAAIQGLAWVKKDPSWAVSHMATIPKCWLNGIADVQYVSLTCCAVFPSSAGRSVWTLFTLGFLWELLTIYKWGRSKITSRKRGPSPFVPCCGG